MSNSKKKKNNYIPLIVYISIWLLCIISYYLFTSPSDAMGYSLLVYYIILPISMFVTSIIIGKNKNIKHIKYYIPILLSIIYMLSEYITLSLSNMRYFSKINSPEISMLLIGLIISYIGLGIGLLIKKK